MSVLAGSPEWLANQINSARETKRRELLPQIAAQIYAGYVGHAGNAKTSRGALMDVAILDAEILLRKLYPPVSEVDNGQS